MRRACMMLAALALAACKVDVEGARCNTPGSTTECPDGQACGNDKKCSTKAGTCVASKTFCTPTVTPDRCSPSSAAAERCTGADTVCGAWSVQVTCATALVCDASGGTPACVCATPSPDEDIVVDLAAPSSALVPTGATQPAACRFTRLGDALTYARDVWLPSHAPASTTVTVRAVGTPSPGTPVTFDAESFPLVVPHGVTLATSATPSKPADWVVSASSTTSNLAEMHDGALIDGFTFRSVSATGDGIAVTCAETSPATIRNVIVDGGGALNRGVVVDGTCGLSATQLDVANASKSGLHVDTGSTAIGISVTGGSLKNNGESGAEVVSGLLSISGDAARFDVSLNARHGIRAATDPLNPRAISLSLAFADVHNNGEVSLLLKELTATSAASVSSSLIRKNSATAAFSLYGTGRIAGGVLLWGNLPMTQDPTPLPAFAFTGNTVCSNTGDAVGVYSNDPWPLSADACGPTTSNVFVAPAPSSYYVFSTTTGAELPAFYNLWSPDPPTGLVLKAAIVPSCGAPASTPTVCN